MKKLLLIISFYFSFFYVDSVGAQNVGIGTNTPNPSAQLDVNSTSRGFLPPRMTFAQRNAIVNPEKGLIVFCLDCGNNGGELQYFGGTAWLNMIGAAAQAQSTTVNLPSVTIGSQTWTTKNLDVAKYRNGDPIPQVTDPAQWLNLTTGAWCWYNNDSATYAAIYGRLYNWYAVNDPRGLAPQGWHVPTDAEWNRLTKFIDPNADTTDCCNNFAGTAMKSTIGWSNNGNGTNSSGFDGLPGGERFFNDGLFSNVGNLGIWWSASEYSTNFAWYRYLFFNISYVFRNLGNRANAFSVRVVRD